jgi:hypothetical protein
MRSGHLVAWASSPKESEQIPWTLGCGAGYTDLQDLHGRRCAADVAQASPPASPATEFRRMQAGTPALHPGQLRVGAALWWATSY